MTRWPCTGGKRIFGGVYHREPGEVMHSRAVYRWGIAPVGEGLTGRGRNAPSPVSTCHRERFSKAGVDHPRLPAAPRPPPAPSRGRAVRGDSPDTVPGGGNRILTRINRDTVVDALPGSVSTGYRQSGEGLTGRGERRRLPPLLSRRVTENLSPGRELTTPTARPLARPPPAPFPGGRAVHGD